MTRWHDLYQALMRSLSALAPGRPVAAAVEFKDERLVSNPALARIADIDRAEAQRLLKTIEEVLRRPARPRMRGFPGIDAVDQAMLEENPLLGQVFIHDAAAALELVQQVKEASGVRRTHNAAATLELLKRVEEAGRR
ncbi:MAG: hypothetical protein ACJ8AW_26900 [Rhodopila sp.]